MQLNNKEDCFVESLGELARLENQLACTEAQADRLTSTAATLRAGAAVGREIQAQKQQAVREAYAQLLLTTPARRFIRLVEALQ